jgi:hypothetical protein
MNVFAELLVHATGQPKPNFTQYQLALTEISESLRSQPEFAQAFRDLRHLMEKNFNLETLDDLVANALKK